MKLNKFLKGILPTIALTGGVIATTVSCNVVKKDAEKKPETPKKDTQTAPDKTPETGVETKPGDKDDTPKPPMKEDEKETLKSDAPSDKTQATTVSKEFTFEKLKVSGKDVVFSLKVKEGSTLTLSADEKLFLTILVHKVGQDGNSTKNVSLELTGAKDEKQNGLGAKETFTFTGSISDTEIAQAQKYFQVSSLKKGAANDTATVVELTDSNTDVEFLN
ncbi:hypothetical protein AAW50_00850 [Mycoplasmopsis canis]|uniref:hypothetical protein n=1 Tax=Mycoplasmopsis canis TaxID=29555 RepID=UPI0006249404|nr:hypothetical protein [Mycoplasmopsis canis]AKF40988.1 hypothetical protein AAW50_00850 [Mycoplasmopsis canis]